MVFVLRRSRREGRLVLGGRTRTPLVLRPLRLHLLPPPAVFFAGPASRAVPRRASAAVERELPGRPRAFRRRAPPSRRLVVGSRRVISRVVVRTRWWFEQRVFEPGGGRFFLNRVQKERVHRWVPQGVEFVFFGPQRPDPELDGPPLGRELHRVPDEVGDDLPQAHLVADEPPRDAVVDAVVEDQALRVGLDGLHLEAQVDARLEQKRPALERHLIRLNLGKIQHVVDDGEESLTRPDDHVVDLRVVLAQTGKLGDELGAGDDGVEGRANLVARVGEKRRLRRHRRVAATLRRV